MLSYHDTWENIFICVNDQCRLEQKVVKSMQGRFLHKSHMNDVRSLVEIRMDIEKNAIGVEKFMSEQDIDKQIAYVEEQQRDLINNINIYFEKIKNDLKKGYVESGSLKELINYIRTDQLDKIEAWKGDFTFLKKIKKFPNVSSMINDPEKIRMDIQDFVMRINQLLLADNQQPEKSEKSDKNAPIVPVQASFKLPSNFREIQIPQQQGPGDKFIGELVKGLKSGYGELHEAIGSVFKGKWSNDFRKGQGVQRFANGVIYKGNFVKGKYNGFGEYIDTNGDVFNGYWSNNGKNGQGEQVAANGNKYRGSYVDSRRQGYGEYNESNGNVFKGYWQNDQKNGQGFQLFSNGDIFKGNYVDGRCNGQGIFTETNSNVFKGQWQNNLKNGQGEQSYADGSKFIGSYVNSKRNGYGELFQKNGDVHRGDWVNDQKQ